MVPGSVPVYGDTDSVFFTVSQRGLTYSRRCLEALGLGCGWHESHAYACSLVGCICSAVLQFTPFASISCRPVSSRTDPAALVRHRMIVLKPKMYAEYFGGNSMEFKGMSIVRRDRTGWHTKVMSRIMTMTARGWQHDQPRQWMHRMRNYCRAVFSRLTDCTISVVDAATAGSEPRRGRAVLVAKGGVRRVVETSPWSLNDDREAWTGLQHKVPFALDMAYYCRPIVEMVADIGACMGITREVLVKAVFPSTAKVRVRRGQGGLGVLAVPVQDAPAEGHAVHEHGIEQVSVVKGTAHRCLEAAQASGIEHGLAHH